MAENAMKSGCSRIHVLKCCVALCVQYWQSTTQCRTRKVHASLDERRALSPLLECSSPSLSALSAQSWLEHTPQTAMSITASATSTRSTFFRLLIAWISITASTTIVTATTTRNEQENLAQHTRQNHSLLPHYRRILLWTNCTNLLISFELQLGLSTTVPVCFCVYVLAQKWNVTAKDRL